MNNTKVIAPLLKEGVEEFFNYCESNNIRITELGCISTPEDDGEESFNIFMEKLNTKIESGDYDYIFIPAQQDILTHIKDKSQLVVICPSIYNTIDKYPYSRIAFFNNILLAKLINKTVKLCARYSIEQYSLDKGENVINVLKYIY